jgi:hypothetical protein
MEQIEEKKKISKKNGIQLCAWLFSYVTTKQNISVQIIFPLFHLSLVEKKILYL